MSDRLERFYLGVISGKERGPAAAGVRALLRCAEPVYAAGINWRNRRYDRGRGVRRLTKPVVSVGNLTAGGTGKTPVVLWLCRNLLQSGLKVAVLLRGYKSTADSPSDEKLLLESELAAFAPGVIVHADPDRFAGGQEVLRDHGDVDVFVLDDGFQHRRLHRDFDLVLIDAGNPLGFGHVHPRGLLREPMSGLRRAQAILLTHRGEVGDSGRRRIVADLRVFNPQSPLYECDHALSGVVKPEGTLHPLNILSGRPCYAFCGIGNPQSFARQIQSLPARIVGQFHFPDHHAYSRADLDRLHRQARSAGAEILLTTQKDWVKIARLPRQPDDLEIWRLALRLDFAGSHQADLLAQIRATLANH